MFISLKHKRITVFTFLFQGVLDEAERIEPAPIGYADPNQGNFSYLKWLRIYESHVFELRIKK